MLAPVNARWQGPRARGVSSAARGRAEQAAVAVAVVCIGTLMALCVNVMQSVVALASSKKEALVTHLRQTGGGTGWLVAWLVHLAIAVACAAIAFTCVCAAPFARGSGIPHLLAYLNGVKLPRFTSARVLLAKALGTTASIVGGFFCGPEGPIIHIGGCCGKLLLRSLYHLGRAWPRLFGPFVAFRNDLDQRDFVAIGAGAGVAAAARSEDRTLETCGHDPLPIDLRARPSPHRQC